MIADRHFRIILRYFYKHYAREVNIKDFESYCLRHKINRKEYLEFYKYLASNNYFSLKTRNTLVPLLKAKIEYQNHIKHNFKFVLMYILGITSTLITEYLLKLLII